MIHSPVTPPVIRSSFPGSKVLPFERRRSVGASTLPPEQDSYERRRSLQSSASTSALQSATFPWRQAPGRSPTTPHQSGTDQRQHEAGKGRGVPPRSPPILSPANSVEPPISNRTELDNEYLRQNVQQLVKTKRMLVEKSVGLEQRVVTLEGQVSQYKKLYEEMLGRVMREASGQLEIDNLVQQLEAVVLVKDTLNDDNIMLREQLKAAQLEQSTASERGVCVICMDHLTNIVCLPCKHNSMCASCAANKALDTCPICREVVQEKLQFFLS
uniref:RING-type domain-containing protein n=1 Tax=Noctiluca scintillans TaxID=2966 RepID=A0A7S1F3J2_NOCSC|mmetsp:Transcript_29712/g.78876  ORF Transcript_29712/g.78876 Transcript_29712/m.78876 type:complete len:271 (+) Transcript_29712:56-868(+)